jgi:large conductance mechanosensitive channel
MALGREFRDFIAKGNVIELAIAVVIGVAFGKIITSFVEGLIMPLVGAAMPGRSWDSWTVTSLDLRVGAVLGAIIEFLVIAAVVFLVLVKGIGALRRRGAAPTTKECPECREVIPLDASRCRACTSPQLAATAA